VIESTFGSLLTALTVSRQQKREVGATQKISALKLGEVEREGSNGNVGVAA
jgi:hypothetical protein